MNIYTLNVGQGEFIVVTGATEAIIVDTSIQISPSRPIINVKAALTDILKGKNLVGVMITGFDSDHFNEIGVKLALNKYRPNWIMYPRYKKNTRSADAAFSAIGRFEDGNNHFNRFSINLKDNKSRFYNRFSKDFYFEVFSPHSDDMDSSNNCSLVCKITERATGGSYLVTGDCENDRWDRIVSIFDDAIECDVLSAPHHGSKNGITRAAIRLMQPHTVLISAGVDNAYGHPDAEAVKIFRSTAQQVYQTNYGEGQSIRTRITKDPLTATKSISSFLYRLPKVAFI